MMTTPHQYQSGFGNEFATEAVAGALPVGQNSPQRAALGLYAEQFSGTSFAAPRAANRRSWLYRIRPSVGHRPFELIEQGRVRGTPFDETKITPNQLRWNPFPVPDAPTDFVGGLLTIAGCGDASMHSGAAIHLYVANRSMSDSFFSNADGELLLVPQQGELLVRTELGVLELKPGEIGVINRGVKFRVELREENAARGYVCENYGAYFRLPDLGVIGANGLANARDFLAPVANYEDQEGSFRIITKFGGQLWATELDHSPLDVVAWHGNYAPYKYNLAHFNALGTVSFDHPDPSLFTVLTSPSEVAGTANVDFVIFPPRWLVAEHTFRPPYFHRNFMSEYMGLIHGAYDAKAEGFLPGGGSLHNSMSAHGPDAATFETASAAELKPHRLDGTLAFMFETRFACRPTRFAMEAPELQRDYDECWRGLRKHFSPQG